jgi:hypothetical protein
MIELSVRRLRQVWARGVGFQLSDVCPASGPPGGMMVFYHLKQTECLSFSGAVGGI